MKLRIFLINILLIAISCTVKITLRQDDPYQENEHSLTYLTLVEGTKDIYEVCKLICNANDMKTYYSESTYFPNYGKLFRCQCNSQFTAWYNLETLAQVGLDLIKGDDLVNYYFNMPGNNENDCKCDTYREILLKMISSAVPSMINLNK